MASAETNTCSCAAGAGPDGSPVDRTLVISSDLGIDLETDPLLFGITMGDLIVTFHYSVFIIMLATFAILGQKEYARAKESWLRASERIKSEEDKHSWELGGGQSSSELHLEEGDEVVNADLGRGYILELLNNNTQARIEFDAMENDPRVVDIKGLLYLGMRVRHGSRGEGTIEKFDDNDRVHVNFDNGEYHRYKYEAWKRKMVPQSHSRLLIERQTFRQFLYEYVLYRSDYTLTTFTFAKPLVLLVSTYTLIVVGAIAYSRASTKTVSESLWVAWTMVADPGTHAEETGTSVRIVALILTLGGMLVFALMIGIIADGVSSLLDGLKQGNSSVIENGHTLVLGWSDKTLPFVREICLANESLGGGVVVILAERPKADMERELMKDLSPEEARGTLVICRSGNPTNQTDLRKVSAGSARSVVVLADNKLDPDESDARVVRCVLSLHGIRKSKTGHVVVEMCDVDNRDLAILADSKNVEVVVAHDLIGRLMIQCAREPGLAQILDEILGFEGDEFYIKPWAGEFAPGTTFGEVLFRFEDAIPLGIKPHDRRDAYEQIYNSKWRRESLKRRGWDGMEPTKTATTNSNMVEISLGLPNLITEDFSLRQGSPNIPVIDHFKSSKGKRSPLRTLESHEDGPSGGEEQDEGEVLEGDTDDEFEDEEVEDMYCYDDDDGEKKSRAVLLNPPNDYILREKDEILVLAEDDDSYKPKRWEELPKAAKLAFESMSPAHRPIVQTRPEKFLFCGWRRDMDDMIMELDQLVGPGSEVTIMCTTPESERIARFEQGGLDVGRLKNLRIRHVLGNPILRRDLRRLPNKLNSYGSVLILADQALETNVSSADSRSLASLLLIRDMIAKRIKQKEKRILQKASQPLLSASSSFHQQQQPMLQKGTSFSDESPRLDTRSIKVAKPPLEKGTSFSDAESPKNNKGRPGKPAPLEKGASFSDSDQAGSPKGGDDASSASTRSPPRRPMLLGPQTSFTDSLPEVSKRPSTLMEMSANSKSLRSGVMGESGRKLLQSDYFVRRPSSVGQALFFENAHNTGSTVLISEILDSRTKALVPVAQIGDHVMSNEIVAATLAMVSECRDISVILSELLQADGNDLHIRSALDYGSPGEKVDFWTLQARARSRGEIAIGYRNIGDKAPTLNPREKCAKFTLSAKGTVIVIAED